MAFDVAATRRRWRWSAAAGWPVRAAAGLALMRVFAEWKHGSSARGAKRAFREPPQVFFSRALASPTRALIHARDTPSPKAAGPHRPDRGLRGWPSGVLSPLASTNKHRPTWHLASSRCCAGDGPEFLATMAAEMKISLRRARWLVLCRRACVALDALLKTPRLCPLVRVSVRTMRLLLIAR